MEDLIRQMIEQIGEDPDREGLLKTPERVAKAWGEIASGYEQDPGAMVRGAQEYNVFKVARPAKALLFGVMTGTAGQQAAHAVSHHGQFFNGGRPVRDKLLQLSRQFAPVL